MPFIVKNSNKIKWLNYKNKWRLNNKIESSLYLFSIYLAPLVIGVISLISMAYWPSQYAPHSGTAIDFKVLLDEEEALHPALANDSMKELASVEFSDTRLSESPFWIQFQMAQLGAHENKLIEFPSRHLSSIACWGGSLFNRLGGGDRKWADGSVQLIKAGFALSLSGPSEKMDIICRTESVGPGRISLSLWNSIDLQQSQLEYHRRSGLLDGGLTVLCAFVLLTALINRSSIYLLFSIWLALNLRMAELSYGWDTQWIGYTVPVDMLPRARSVTIASYYLITVALFSTLFKEDLHALKSLKFFRFAQWTCVPMVLLSIALDYQVFLPILWFFTAFNISVLIYYLGRILIKTRSRVAIWYGVGLAITLFASFSEVVAASIGLKVLIGSVNSVTAALSSSLLTAVAIAEHIRQEHKQRMEVQAELTHTFNAMPIGMFTLGPDGFFLSANPALIDMLGQDVVATQAHWRGFFEDGAWVQLHRHMQERRGPRTERRAQIAIEFRSGQEPPGESQRAPVEFETRGATKGAGGEARRYLLKATLTRGKIQGSLQDVTEKSRATDELYFLANHDSLTKVLNRRGLESAMQAALQGLPSGKSMSMAYLDLDRFKLINDMFGHAVGDEVLQQVCLRVSAMLPAGMAIGRVGGDEFVMVFSETPVAMAAHMCRGIVDCIGKLPYRLGGSAFYVHGSIGLIEVDTGMQLKDALSGADRACQHAKLANRGGLLVYQKHSPYFMEHEAQLKLIAQLSDNEPYAGLYLEMQPIMSLSKPTASLDFEVLLRMRCSDADQVPTARLIAAAQASGRMGKIDLWVVSSILNWLNTHHKELTQTHFVCVNLSGSSLNDEQFLTEVYELLENNRHIVHMVCLEITESIALNDIDNTRKFVNKVRRIGARVALDDFGAGYTSFAYLKEICADMIKIDGSFIRDMNKHPVNLAIVETIVDLAKNLGMKVIAEWVEDHETLQTLTEIGVDYAQGFVISKALPPQAMIMVTSASEFLTPQKPIRIVPPHLQHQQHQQRSLG